MMRTALMLAVGACAPGEARQVIAHDSVVVAPLTEVPRRRIDIGAWDTLVQFGSIGPGGERPERVALSAGGFVFFSERSQQLVALDSSGHPRWRVGPALPSGDTLHSSVELRTLRDGRVVSLDARSRRATMLRPDGSVERELDLRAIGLPMGVVELDAERLLILAADTTAAFAVVSREGRPLGHVGFPSARYADLHTLARPGVVSGDGRGRWVFAFRLGNGLIAFNDTVPAGPWGSFAEAVRFPAVIEERGENYRVARLGRITRSASAVAVSGDHTYVVFGGESSERGRIVDVHDFPTSAYRHSLVMPERIIDLVPSTGHLVALTGGQRRVLVRVRLDGLGEGQAR